VHSDTFTRAKTVAHTSGGIKIVKQAVKTVEQFDNTFFQPLGKKTKEFNSYLLTLLEN
jgi:hypothetical protein